MTILHALPVAGGILAISAIPGADGDLAGDLSHLADWRPSVVISLVTVAEFETLGAGRLASFVADHGARWEHLPVVDFGTPDAAFEWRWAVLSRAILKALAGGGRVLVHCRGGCGRSGMLALRLMIEAGEAPDDALARLRAVRPCAVETAAQLRWAVSVRRDAARFLRHED
ncbi:protein-tyrosine phosphatase family protein [Salipiger sp. 1_MG-2023]|uniref:phosphatase domain-containing protein n=1 Tax=Salipiger sp. 1_MG-2023 TaxID=3062665 RepID=UPI0026E12AE7|nr:protein-tyrosine phosphatase family protein [Salipiger sp. 1_MG-2023]MDO6584043.1 protein-tyrosine phosphatase family protein [Salipiger sp. 1_MG-2023]